MVSLGYDGLLAETTWNYVNGPVGGPPVGGPPTGRFLLKLDQLSRVAFRYSCTGSKSPYGTYSEISARATHGSNSRPSP